MAQLKYTVGTAIAFLGLASVPPQYARWVVRLADRLQSHVQYQRPPPVSEGVMHHTSSSTTGLHGSFKDNRIVKEEADGWKHLEDAATRPFPQPAFERRVEPSLEAAIDIMMSDPDGLAQLQSEQLAMFRECAADLAGLNQLMVNTMSDSVRHCAGSANVALIACTTEACNWPFIRAAEYWCKGFPIAGCGSPAEPAPANTGLFREVHRPAEYTLDELCHGDVPGQMSNTQWLQHCDISLKAKATAAKAKGDKHFQPFAEIEKTIERERRAPGGPTLQRGKTLRQLTKFAAEHWGGVQAVRPVILFAIEQGLREDGSTKWRGIDDLLHNGINAAAATWETVYYITFEWPALAAREVAKWCKAHGTAMVELALALDDIRHAYRTVPNGQPWLCVIAAFSSAAGCVLYYTMPGHPFGAIASVLNFCQQPHLLVHVARVWLGIPVDHYVDDLVQIMLRSMGDHPQIILGELMALFGSEQEPAKRKVANMQHICLGVGMSLAGVLAQATCVAFPTPARIAEVLTLFRAAKTLGYMTVHAAEQLFGKLGFLLCASSQRIGRAASQVIVQVMSRRHAISWDAAFEHALNFYDALFRVLPGLSIPLFREVRKPVILYTDASFRYEGLNPIARIAFFIYDPHLHVCVYGTMVLPLWFYAFFAPDKATYIMQAELVAAVCAYISCPHLLRDRPVWHFIDNTGALSCLIHGYAGQEDCAHFVNAFHMTLLGIRSQCYFEFVKSEANIADWPTREDKFHLIPRCAIRVPVVLPSQADWLGPLSDWTEKSRIASVASGS